MLVRRSICSLWVCLPAIFGVGLGAVVLLVVGCDRDPGGTDDQDSASKALLLGHQKMLEILQGIKEQAPAEHQYFGRGDLGESRKRLEKLPPDASSYSRFSLLGEVGYNELLYGDIQLAIDHLLEAYQLLPSVASEKPDASKEAGLHVRFILGVVPAVPRTGSMAFEYCSHDRHKPFSKGGYDRKGTRFEQGC